MIGYLVLNQITDQIVLKYNIALLNYQNVNILYLWDNNDRRYRYLEQSADFEEQSAISEQGATSEQSATLGLAECNFGQICDCFGAECDTFGGV